MIDSGTAGNFITMKAKVKNIGHTYTPINVVIPDGSKIQCMHECDKDLPLLSPEACYGYAIPGLAQQSLISVVQLC